MNKKILFGVISGWGSQFLSLCIGLFTYPVFFHYLPKDELGIWMFFLGTSIFINLADFGFSPVLGRHLAFELGKADRDAVPNETAAAYYFSLARFVSLATSVALFILMLGIGGVFLYSMDIKESLRGSSLIAWIIFALAQSLSCQYRYLETTLNGHGEVGWQNLLQVIVQLLALLGYFSVLALHVGGIVALAGVMLGRSILLAVGCRVLVGWRMDRHAIKTVPVSWLDVKPHVRPALDLFLMTFGAFLILNTDQYFIVLFLGADKLPDYAASYRLVSVVYTFAASASMMCVPFVSRLSASGKVETVHSLLLLNITVGMMIQISGACLLAIFGDYLIGFWLGDGHFVGWPIVWVFCIMLTLENHHVIFARFGMNAKTDASWGKVSVIAGVLNLGLSYLGVHWLGLLGVALATMLTQLLTNNWYAVWKTLKIIDLSFSEYMRSSGIIWIASGCILLWMLYLIRTLSLPPLAALITSLAGALSLFSAILYAYALKNKALLT